MISFKLFQYVCVTAPFQLEVQSKVIASWDLCKLRQSSCLCLVSIVHGGQKDIVEQVEANEKVPLGVCSARFHFKKLSPKKQRWPPSGPGILKGYLRHHASTLLILCAISSGRNSM